jgi:hypothetical protein
MTSSNQLPLKGQQHAWSDLGSALSWLPFLHRGSNAASSASMMSAWSAAAAAYATLLPSSSISSMRSESPASGSQSERIAASINTHSINGCSNLHSNVSPNVSSNGLIMLSPFNLKHGKIRWDNIIYKALHVLIQLYIGWVCWNRREENRRLDVNWR